MKTSLTFLAMFIFGVIFGWIVDMLVGENILLVCYSAITELGVH